MTCTGDSPMLGACCPWPAFSAPLPTAPSLCCARAWKVFRAGGADCGRMHYCLAHAHSIRAELRGGCTWPTPRASSPFHIPLCFSARYTLLDILCALLLTYTIRCLLFGRPPCSRGRWQCITNSRRLTLAEGRGPHAARMCLSAVPRRS